jgi:CRP/FNR family cyclic AMP-dependent transcriptional regulator
MNAGQKLDRFRVNFGAGETIFEEGEIGAEMFVVTAGRIEIIKKVHGMEKVLLTMGKGDFFGEMSLLEGLPRSAAARALEESELIMINGAALEQMIASEPELATRMLKKMSERLREADRQIGTLLFRDDTSRVVHALTMMAENRGEMSDSGLEIRLTTTERDIAAAAGVTQAYVTTALQQLEMAKILRVTGNTVHIQNPDALENYLRYLRWRRATFSG